MFELRYAEVGDILTYDADDSLVGRVIAWFSGGGKAHVSMVSQLQGTRVKIIEAHLDAKDDNGVPNRGKVLEKTLSPKWYKAINIRRVKGGLSDMQKNTLITVSRIKDVGIVDYDLGSFPSMFVYSRVFQLLGWRSFRKNKPVLNNPKKQVCSTLIANRYLWTLGLNICEEVNPHSCTPVDLDSTKSLVTIS